MAEMGDPDEVSTGQLYKAILSQREWTDRRLTGVERSVRADVVQVRDAVVSLQISVAGLPCQRHAEEIKETRVAIAELRRSAGLAKLFTGIPAAMSALAAALLAYFGITGGRP